MNITVYCASSMGDDPLFQQAARELGEWVADAGHTLVYGGSSIGLMGIVSGAALERGGQVIGVEPRFFIEAGVAQHELTELIVTDDMSERKAKMIELGDAFVALPGGLGTLEEISEIASRIRLRLTAAPCVFINLNGFYDELRAFIDKLFACGFVNEYEYRSIAFLPTVAEAARYLEAWRLDQTAHDDTSAIYG